MKCFSVRKAVRLVGSGRIILGGFYSPRFKPGALMDCNIEMNSL